MTLSMKELFPNKRPLKLYSTNMVIPLTTKHEQNKDYSGKDSDIEIEK